MTPWFWNIWVASLPQVEDLLKGSDVFARLRQAHAAPEDLSGWGDALRALPGWPDFRLRVMETTQLSPTF